MSLDISLLQVVQALSRYGTVTAAASSLGLTQSTVSHALGRLRRHYGDALFVPAGKQLSRTPLAQRLIEEADRFLKDFERLQTLTADFDPRVHKRRFRVHMIDVAELLILPSLLRHVASEGPGIEIEVVRVPGIEAWSELESGRLDLVIGTPRKAQPSLYRQSLYEEQYVGIARHDHPLKNQLETLKGYIRAVHCVVAPRGPALARLEAALAALSPERKVVLQVPDFLSVPTLVRQSDLVAAVPATLIEAHPDRSSLCVFKLPTTHAKFMVVQHWHRRVHEDTGNAWLRNAILGIVPGDRAPIRNRGKR
jgi:DNA-binding transcriptional LysR family regulator